MGLKSSGYILAVPLDTEIAKTAFHSGMKKAIKQLRNWGGSCHSGYLFQSTFITITNGNKPVWVLLSCLWL